MIEKIVAQEDSNYQPLLDTYQDTNNFHRLAEGQYFLPGFVDLHVHTPQWAIFNENEDLDDIFQKIMYLARPENIREVWVQGNKVHSR